MRQRCLVLAMIFVLAGCATADREAAAEARGFERGYWQAVKEQYWRIQNQQRHVPVTDPGKP